MAVGPTFSNRSITYITMTNKLCNLARRAMRCLRGSAIGLLGIGGLITVQQPAFAADQYTGKGQTIVVVATGLSSAFKATTAQTALNNFSRDNALPECNTANPCFEVVDLAPSSPRDWYEEQSVYATTQKIHEVAPAAKIVLLAMDAGQPSAVAQKIEQLKPTAVALILRDGELQGQTSTRTDCLCDGFFAAHREIAFFSIVSSFPKTLSYPATSPHVTAVGSQSWASGSGSSTLEAMPAFQKSYLTNNDSLLVSNGKRVIPDVADQSYQGFGVWNEIELSPFVGGSSVVATGRWAGIAALLAEGLQEKSYSLAELLRASGGLNNLLYATDVAKTFSRPTADGFHAEQGLGVPDVTKLISALRSRVPLIASAVQGTTLNPLMSIRSLNGTYVLKMQLDGNLVLFNGSGSAIWNTGTQSYPGAYATLQKDGNLVVYDAKAQYKWASWSNSYTGINARLSIDDDGSMRIFKPQTSLWTIGTRLTSYADPQPAWGSSVWPIGTILKNGQFISSVNGENKFVMQNDGNLVLYHKDVATWSSATNGNVNAYAKMQADGNLVVYAADGSALWHAGTWGHPGASAVVQDDGTVVLYTWQFMN